MRTDKCAFRIDSNVLAAFDYSTTDFETLKWCAQGRWALAGEAEHKTQALSH